MAQFTDPDDRVSAPTIMQKVVPHNLVAWYLEQGYDRVGGFVHSTGDVAELQTPGQLYEALGLLYDGSAFSPADDGVYVIRWPAYCPDLYRVPFGGRDEAELAAWGEGLGHRAGAVPGRRVRAGERRVHPRIQGGQRPAAVRGGDVLPRP